MSIATEIQRLQTAKEDITRALLSIGIDIPSGITLDEYPPYIAPYFFEELTFNIISGGTINWKAISSDVIKRLSYSFDNGETWSEITSSISGTSFNVNDGDRVLFKGDNGAYGTSTSFSTFSGTTAVFEVEGNIMSLIDSTGFVTATTLGTMNTFHGLFYGCSTLISAENLVLPATTLAQSCYTNMFDACTALTKSPKILPATTVKYCCYQYMFAGCTGLTTAPELPATTLASYCYRGMFSSCGKINYIKCLATDISAVECVNGWLTRVSSTGTFVKNANMSNWTRGNNGIPNSWTVQDAS